MHTIDVEGHKVVFQISTGQVAGSAKRSETHTSGGGGGGYIGTNAFGDVHGHISSVSISSYSVEKLEFWLKCAGEPDQPVSLTAPSGRMIPVMDGQTVTLIRAQVDGGSPRIVRIVNHDSRKVWPWNTAREVFPHPKQPPIPSMAPVWLGWVAWLFLALLVRSVVAFALIIVPIGLAVQRKRQRTAAVLFEFDPALLKSNGIKFGQFEREADRFAQEALASVH